MFALRSKRSGGKRANNHQGDSRFVGDLISVLSLNDQQNQMQTRGNLPINAKKICRKQSPSPICGMGNVFLLGMTVLISEVIDLTAAKSLAYLLASCLPDEETAEEIVEGQAAANQVSTVIEEIEEATFIPIAFE